MADDEKERSLPLGRCWLLSWMLTAALILLAGAFCSRFFINLTWKQAVINGSNMVDIYAHVQSATEVMSGFQ